MFSFNIYQLDGACDIEASDVPIFCDKNQHDNIWVI